MTNSRSARDVAGATRTDIGVADVSSPVKTLATVVAYGPPNGGSSSVAVESSCIACLCDAAAEVRRAVFKRALGAVFHVCAANKISGEKT
jgi:hypothetical protein